MNGFMNGKLINIRGNSLWLPMLALLSFLLGGCGGGASNPVSVDPNGGNQALGSGSAKVSPYNGPAPRNADVQRFKINFYDVFRASNRCGACHNTGGQSPQFVREDDVNAAYDNALTVVNLTNPGASRVVEKVGGGHNCWGNNTPAVCAGDLQRAIEAWANGSSSSTTQIQLHAPADHDITVTKQFPVSGQSGYESVVSAFSTTVYPLFASYGCDKCHQASSPTAQQPYFASPDIHEAYDAAVSKMDVDDGVLDRTLPQALSRFVVRMRDEFHNCGNSCQDFAAEFLTQIKALVGQVPQPAAVPADWVTSKAVVLKDDGVLASGGGRVDTGEIAKWDFSEGSNGGGNVAADSSGVDPRMNLTLSGDVTWVRGDGIQIKKGGKAQATTTTSKKLADMIKASGEYTVEAWVAPANVTQEGPARIITYSGGPDQVNFALGQTKYDYNFLLRSSTTDSNGDGMPSLDTADAAERLQATLQHVVITYSPTDGRRIYVNGVYTGDADTVAGGNLNGWNDGYAFILGSESSGALPWEGVIRFVAIYNRELNASEIAQNYKAGVGEKYYLMFDVTDLVGINDGFRSYVVFGTSIFDSYSYLFDKPFFYRLPDTGTAADATQSNYSGIPVEGIRIGINGKEPAVGQGYSKLSTTLESSQYGNMGQTLSNIGTIMALEGGPAADQFFLTFEQIGTHTDARVEGTVTALPLTATDPEPTVGLRDFAEINASMSKITGVPTTNANVVSTYNTVIQQLPNDPAIETFVSAQQMGVAQMAIQYCSEMVDNNSLRTAFFPSFTSFDLGVDTAFGTAANRSQIIDPLYAKVVGLNLLSQPNETDMKNELDSLMVKLSTAHAGGDSTATRNIVKATCAAALGSAAVLLQ